MRAARTVQRLACVVVSLLAASACTFDYSGATIEGEVDGALPQVEILDVRMVIERENRLELTARRIASFPDEGYQQFGGLEFREFGPDGELRLEGRAEAGTLFFDTENVELRGVVRFYSQVEEAELQSEFLYWNDAERVLSGEDEDVVTLDRDDGSQLRGYGLRLDGRRNSLEFDRGVEGVFSDEDDS